MKKNPLSLILLIALFTTTFSYCRKNKAFELPEETQTGKGTFGCRIDGVVFSPGGSSLSGSNFAAIYQYLYPGTATGYTFALGATDKRNPSDITTVGFGFDSVQMAVGTYPLKIRSIGSGGGSVNFVNRQFPNGNKYSTNHIVTGELNLKRFDVTTQIVSGTFWFDAVNEHGDTVKVRDGRFDTGFTM